MTVRSEKWDRVILVLHTIMSIVVMATVIFAMLATVLAFQSEDWGGVAMVIVVLLTMVGLGCLPRLICVRLWKAAFAYPAALARILCKRRWCYLDSYYDALRSSLTPPTCDLWLALMIAAIGLTVAVYSIGLKMPLALQVSAIVVQAAIIMTAGVLVVELLIVGVAAGVMKVLLSPIWKKLAWRYLHKG